jgi:FMN phosphatase YigB (HAD superfamily)
MDSYDVFETVLLRVVGEPQSLFFFVGQLGVREGILPFGAGVFREMRIEAEKEAYKRVGHPGLEDIYQVLGTLAGLGERELGFLRDAELKLEKAGSRVNPVFQDKVVASRKRHGRVLFLSDMYLPHEFLEGNLRDKGLLQGEDCLYLSNREKAGKGYGQLFEKVLAKEGLVPANLRHHGNCRQADVDAARELGISAEHFSEGNLSVWEEYLESLSIGTDGIASLWAGASRRARCSLPGGSLSHSFHGVLCQTAASIAAPVLLSYVHWCLDRALEDGLKQLAFVARDGEILYKVARVLKEANKNYEGIGLKYIYGSRQAWRPASLVDLGDFEKVWILEGGNELSREKVVARLGLEPRYADGLPETGSPEELWSALLEKLKDPALEQSAKTRARVLEYLGQEGLLEDGVGFAEIGCTGLTMACLDRILSFAGIAPPQNYFFGLSPDTKELAPSRATAYFYNSMEGFGFSPSPDFNYFVLLEMFCSSTHGRTTGYHPVSGRVAPSFEQPQRYWEKQTREVELFQDAVLSFARAYVDSPLLLKDPRRALPLCAKVLRKFWQRPTPEEAEVWGSYHKEHDQSGLDCLEMGRRLVAKDFIGCVGTQGLPHTWWEAASVLRTPLVIQRLLELGTRVGVLLAKSRIVLGGWKSRIIRN